MNCFDDVSVTVVRGAFAAATALAMLAVAPSPASAQEADQTQGDEQSGGGGDASLQRSDRMEFDARLIRGERASGAVFLFQRAPRELPSMVERRRTFLEASVRSVLGKQWAETFVDNRADHLEESSSSE